MTKSKILFIDDEPLICECFAEQFESDKIEILTFTDAQKAIDYLKTSTVDAVFIDYRMPGQKGDEVAHKMPSQIPKYLVSGELDAQPNFKFIEVLPKPFDVDKMGEIIKGYIKS